MLANYLPTHWIWIKSWLAELTLDYTCFLQDPEVTGTSLGVTFCCEGQGGPDPFPLPPLLPWWLPLKWKAFTCSLSFTVSSWFVSLYIDPLLNYARVLVDQFYIPSFSAAIPFPPYVFYQLIVTCLTWLWILLKLKVVSIKYGLFN